MAQKHEKGRTDEELYKIAEDIFKGFIFTDRQLPRSHENKSMPDADMIQSVFMVLALMDKKVLKQIEARKPGMFFEYMNKAGHWAINGYPTFGSLQIASVEETEKIWKYYETIRNMNDELKKAVVAKPEEGKKGGDLSQMPQLRVVGGEGDVRVAWNTDNPWEVMEAKKQFEKFVKEKKYHAFRVRKGEKTDERIYDFDPAAEIIVLSPPPSGG